MTRPRWIPGPGASGRLKLLLLPLMLLGCQGPVPGTDTPPGDRVLQVGAAPEVEYLSSPEFLAMDLPFSEAVRVGHTLYLSGQIGNLPGTLELAPGGIGPETRQTLENIRSVLERFGSSLDRVVKCIAMLDDMGEWPAMNEVYVTYFPENRPARSALGADGLALGARVEIECIATVD